MKLSKALFLLVVLSFLASCVGRRSVNYLQDPSLSATSKLFPNRKAEYRIQVNDVLSIRVLGLDDDNVKNFNVETSGNFGMGANEASLYVNGYTVDRNGVVLLPTVGKFKVQGFTVNEAQEALQRRISEYFNNATVTLKLVNFRVSVLGAVERPGSYYVYNNQINVLEALALCGGPQEYADKRKVTLMRQSDQGTQAVYLDLSRTDLLTSEYYHMQPNDVIYVPALGARPSRMNLELLGILFAGITAAGVVVTIVNQNR